MHNAPSVSYPAGRSRLGGVLLLGSWLLGCAAAGIWQAYHPDLWRTVMMLAALWSTGAFAAWRWWHTPTGTLAWDGEHWTWSGLHGESAASLDVGLDLQRTLLLRWGVSRSAHWIWLDRQADALRWEDLRRAVYSRARPKALQQATRPAAKT